VRVCPLDTAASGRTQQSHVYPDNDQPNEKGIATMKLTSMTQVTVDGTQTTDPEAGR
jgi:hypothetical protein